MQKTTNLVVANQTESLRTTVPSVVVELFELDGADQLEWVIDVKTDPPTIHIIPVKMDPEKRAELKAKREARTEKRRATIKNKG